MEKERSFATRALSIIGFGLLAFAITVLAGGIWSALLVANLRSSPAVPWSVPVMGRYLWFSLMASVFVAGATGQTQDWGQRASRKGGGRKSPLPNRDQRSS